jgi:peroxiredoxin
LKRWIIVAISLLTVSAAPGFAAADRARPGAAAIESAPDFQFLGNDGRWRFLHDLRSQGHVLMVFEPGDRQLAALELEVDSLRARGVIPVAVFRNCEAENWSRIERLGLTFSLLSDPRGDLAAQFEIAPDPARRSPGWCLVDRDGRLRELEGDAPPASGFADAAALALQPREQAAVVGPPRP